jgi:hypothetical protein
VSSVQVAQIWGKIFVQFAQLTKTALQHSQTGRQIIPYQGSPVKHFLKKFFQSIKNFFVNRQVAQIFISVFVQLVY